MALLRRQPIDRVSISTYGVDRYSSPWMAEDPSYEQLLAVTDTYEDIFVKYGCLYADFTEIAETDPAIETRITYERVGKSLFRKAEIYTPRRTLTSKARWDDGLHMTWFLEHYLKDEEDIKAFLALPQSPPGIETGQFEKVQKELGDRGLMMMHIGDPMGYVARLLGIESFLMMSLTHQDLIDELFKVIWQRVRATLIAYLQAGLGPVYRIFGAEYATPPMLPPKLFERWVVHYDSEIIELIQQHGCYARFHCHGRVRQVLPMIRAMHPDILDPCEAPPGGDITMTELAQLTRDELILMGNIQSSDMESAPPEEIDRQVRELIQVTRGIAPFVLSSTAGLYSSPLDPIAERNFIRFVRAGIEYGVLD